MLNRLMLWSNQALEKEWFQNGMEASDRATGKEKGRAELLRFETIARECAYISLAWCLTDDKKYAPVIDRLVELASYPPGGLSALEGHGSNIKFTTRIVLYMALCYDWLYDKMSANQRKTLLDSMAWRLRLPMLEGISLAKENGSKMLTMGVAIEAGSHPYQNIMWITPAALLLAGEHPEIDELVAPMLHYLSGVSGGAGPDEAWNEGPH